MLAAGALLDYYQSGGAGGPGWSLNGGVQTGNQSAPGGRLFSGSGVPAAALGANGDLYQRTDTPGTANQRLYVKSAGAWVGIL